MCVSGECVCVCVCVSVCVLARVVCECVLCCHSRHVCARTHSRRACDRVHARALTLILSFVRTHIDPPSPPIMRSSISIKKH